MQSIKDFITLDKWRRRRFEQKYCLHPDAPTGCSPSFGAAHTIQRAIIQRFIAENQHVLQFVLKTNPKRGAGPLVPQRTGINKASTFFGYCGIHDNDLFRPLETQEFVFSDEQIALLGFRALSRELYLKDAQADQIEMLGRFMKGSSDLATPDRALFLLGRGMGIHNAQRNLKEAWKKYGKMIANRRFEDLIYYAVRFEDSPAYMASVGFLPEYDFRGNELQYLGRTGPFQPITFSAWAAGNNAVAVFSWHSSWNPICAKFVESLRKIDEAMLASRILSMAFDVSENVIFRESWWEGLSSENKKLIAARASSGLLSDEKDSRCLLDHGLTALHSRVLEIKTNT